MSERIHMEDTPNWPMFYRKLCHVGPVALTGLPREWIPMLQSYARTGDLFWSDCLQAALFECWGDPSAAVDRVMQVFAENVRLEFREPPLCWLSSWRTLPDSGGSMPMEDCIQQINYRLTARLRKALVSAAQSNVEPTSCHRRCRLDKKEKARAAP